MLETIVQNKLSQIIIKRNQENYVSYRSVWQDYYYYGM